MLSKVLGIPVNNKIVIHGYYEPPSQYKIKLFLYRSDVTAILRF